MVQRLRNGQGPDGELSRASVKQAGAGDPAAAPGALRSSLGPDTSISGKLSFHVPTRIDGKLKGEVRASDLLVIGEQSRVEGAVRAIRLVVDGEVRGEVRGAERVEIGPSGRVSGIVEAESLVVREGAYLDADCRIAPQPAEGLRSRAFPPLAEPGKPAVAEDPRLVSR